MVEKEPYQIRDLLIALAVGLLFFAGAFTVFSFTQAALVGVIALLVTLWTNEALPLAVTSLLPIILFPALGIMETKETSMNYSHPIIFLFFGGFLLAIAVEKSNLHKYIASKMLGIFPNTPRGIIFSLIFTSGLLSSVLSNTTTTLLLISIAIFITEDIKLKMRFALAIAYGASVGGILTPIGTPPNLVLLGIMQSHSMENIPFFKWVFMSAPLVVLMFIAVGALLSIGVSKSKIEVPADVPPLDIFQKKILILTALLVVLLFLNAPIRPYWEGLGLSEAGILLGAGLMLFMPPFHLLDWMKDKVKIPFRIMFLFGAGFAIAKAFSQTGLADEIASYLMVLTTLTPILFLLGIALLVTFATEITSNTALISIMLPVIYSISIKSNIDPTLYMMVATLCASYAFMLPIATPPNAIAMSSGVVNTADMIRYGAILNFIGVALIVLIAHLFWRHLI